MKSLDFIIIGAQKSATTALYSYLAEHPGIAMPDAKEAPFFDGDAVDAEAWAAFSAGHFPAPDGRLWGKASPQYMGHPLAARRIATLMPEVRLVALLRDPLDRAWSHYQMCRRREVETRSFDEAVAHCLSPAIRAVAREAAPPRHRHGLEPESDFYLAWSEYGRILGAYLACFPREQILALTTDELKRDPGGTLDRVLEFIGLAPGHRPPNLGKVVHRGGGRPLITAAQRHRLRALAPLRWAWQCLPQRRREVLRFWFDQKNVRRTPGEAMQLSDANLARVQAHFAADLGLLQRDFGAAPPWAGQYLATVAKCEVEGFAKCESGGNPAPTTAPIF